MKISATHYLQSMYKRGLHIARNQVVRANRMLQRFERVVWIIGDGRSGTTWIQEMISRRYRFRMMYEPFHPDSGRLFAEFEPNQYIRASDQENPMINAARSVFSGRYCTAFTDRDNKSLYYNGLVIKDIYANLLAGWVANHFPQVKIVLLVRDPFSVALSKSRTKNWCWPSDPATFTIQHDLMQDYAGKLGELARFAGGDFINRQILVWSVLNRVAIDQLAGKSVYLLFYEDVLKNPNVEIDRLMQHAFGDQFAGYPALGEAAVRSVSRGSRHCIAARDERNDYRQTIIAGPSLQCGLTTLRELGVNFLYSDTATPLIQSGPLQTPAI